MDDPYDDDHTSQIFGNTMIDCTFRFMKPICYFVVVASLATAADDFPIVPDDVEVALFAQEPLVRNPCGLALSLIHI